MDPLNVNVYKDTSEQLAVGLILAALLHVRLLHVHVHLRGYHCYQVLEDCEVMVLQGCRLGMGGRGGGGVINFCIDYLLGW